MGGDSFYSQTDLEKEREQSLMWARRLSTTMPMSSGGHGLAIGEEDCTFRGTGLSPQGDDFDKAIIRFKRWKLGRGFICSFPIVAGSSSEGLEKRPLLRRPVLQR